MSDLIQIYKLINKLDDIELDNPLNTSNLSRPHNQRLVRENCVGSTKRHGFLTNRVVTAWNNLTGPIVNAPSINSFKAKIDAHIEAGNLVITEFTA